MQNKNLLGAFEPVFRVQFYILINQLVKRDLLKSVQPFAAAFLVKGYELRANLYLISLQLVSF